MNNGADIVCFWASGSAPSWRVTICLHEKQLSEAKLEQLSMSDNEHKEPKITELNPRGQAPTFKDGNVIINESLAICQYLAETYNNQGTQLIPDHPIQYGLMLQRIHEIQNLYSKIMNLAMIYWKKKTYYTDEMVKKKVDDFYNEIKLWDSYITHGNLISDKYSLGDVCLFPVIAFMVRLGFEMPQLKNLNEFYQNNLKRESIINTWPPHWKESKNKTIFNKLRIK